jgi:hypothetical protein
MLRYATNRGAFWTTRPFDLLHASSEDARLCPPHKPPLFSSSSIATIMTVRSLALLLLRRLPMLSHASQTGTGLLPSPPFLKLIVPLLGKEDLVRLNGSNRLSPKPSVTGCPSWLCSTTPANPVGFLLYVCLLFVLSLPIISNQRFFHARWLCFIGPAPRHISNGCTSWHRSATPVRPTHGSPLLSALNLSFWYG